MARILYIPRIYIHRSSRMYMESTIYIYMYKNSHTSWGGGIPITFLIHSFFVGCQTFFVPHRPWRCYISYNENRVPQRSLSCGCWMYLSFVFPLPPKMSLFLFSNNHEFCRTEKVLPKHTNFIFYKIYVYIIYQQMAPLCVWKLYWENSFFNLAPSIVYC